MITTMTDAAGTIATIMMLPSILAPRRSATVWMMIAMGQSITKTWIRISTSMLHAQEGMIVMIRTPACTPVRAKSCATDAMITVMVLRMRLLTGMETDSIRAVM